MEFSKINYEKTSFCYTYCKLFFRGVISGNAAVKKSAHPGIHIIAVPMYAEGNSPAPDIQRNADSNPRARIRDASRKLQGADADFLAENDKKPQRPPIKKGEFAPKFSTGIPKDVSRKRAFFEIRWEIAPNSSRKQGIFIPSESGPADRAPPGRDAGNNPNVEISPKAHRNFRNGQGRFQSEIFGAKQGIQKGTRKRSFQPVTPVSPFRSETENLVIDALHRFRPNKSQVETGKRSRRICAKAFEESRIPRLRNADIGEKRSQ